MTTVVDGTVTTRNAPPSLALCTPERALEWVQYLRVATTTTIHAMYRNGYSGMWNGGSDA